MTSFANQNDTVAQSANRTPSTAPCEHDTPRSKTRVANAIIWAALILASAIIISSFDGAFDGGRLFSYLMLVVFIPLWFASDQLIRKALTGGDRD